VAEIPHDGGAAIVVGAAGPVGAAVVDRLRAEGMNVAGLDGVEPAGDLKVVVDATDRAALAAAVDRVIAEFGPVSVLVTTPWAFDDAPAGEMDNARWERLLRSHLGLTTNAVAAVVPAMVDAGHGTVVITSSWLALAGVPGRSHMAAATGTLLSFTKGFSTEVAPAGVRVNCIAVGPLDAADVAGAAVATPLGRRATLDEVADTVAFLVRDGDFYVGQVFEPAAGAVV
jgi:NAD(P)-dependent dehydrogenase (short-subunit alcohol dehydrogenase family)